MKRDCINLVLSISLAIVSYIFSAKLIAAFYKPDISLILETARKVLIPGVIYQCVPEPLEKTLFIAGILFIPAFLFIFYFIFQKLLRNKSENIIDKIWIFVCVYSLTIIPLFIYKIMKTPCAYAPEFSNLQLYIMGPTVTRNALPLVFVPLIIILYLFIRTNFLLKDNPAKFVKVLLDFLCLLLIAYMTAVNLFSLPFWKTDHFEAVFYPIVQLFKGVVLGVDGFTGTYGFYPYFLNPIFKITGLSVLTCSIVFCIIMVLSYLLILLFLKKTVNNKFLILLGFASVIFIPALAFELDDEIVLGQAIPYYQYLPLRYLFPCLLLFLGSLYIKNRSKNIYILVSVLSSLSIFWNFDSGVITLFSWMLLNFYGEFEQNDARTIFKNILLHLVKISAVLILTALFFYLCVFIFYGRIIDMGAMTQTLNLFSNLGLMMMPMPLLHTWNILALAYMAGIGISIRALMLKDITPWTKHIFLVTIMGTGMLLYYQGRSHDCSLFGPSFYFFILLTLFLDRSLSFLKDNKNLLLEFLSFLMAFVLSLSLIFVLFTMRDEIRVLKNSMMNLQANYQLKSIVQMNCNFIKNHTNPSEKIIIVSSNSSTYFSRIPNVSAVNPSLAELVLKSDYARLEKAIAAPDVKVFVDGNAQAYQKIKEAFESLQIIDTNRYMFLFGHKDTREEAVK